MRAIVPPDPSSTPTTAGDDIHTLPSAPPASRLVLFGMRCHFTAEVLRHLLHRGATIVAVFVPGPPALARPLRLARRFTLPLAGQTERLTLDDLAHEHDVPVYQIGQLRSPALVEVLRGTQPDLMAVACYPTRIPAAVRILARVGAFNIHPSLLPDKRGPDPWFWTFHAGSRTAGVTVHELTEQFDSGGIAAQESWRLADGTTEAQLALAAAERGAALFLNVARRAEHGALVLRAQDEASATWAPFPRAEDYRLDASMTARAAFNFVRGVQSRGKPISVSVNGSTLQVVDAVAYRDRQFATDAVPADVVPLPFHDGMLLARVTVQTDR